LAHNDSRSPVMGLLWLLMRPNGAEIVIVDINPRETGGYGKLLCPRMDCTNKPWLLITEFSLAGAI